MALALNNQKRVDMPLNIKPLELFNWVQINELCFQQNIYESYISNI